LYNLKIIFLQGARFPLIIAEKIKKEDDFNNDSLVVIIDEHQDDLKVLEDCFKETSVTLVVVENHQDVLEKIKTFSSDIILIDSNLKSDNALEICHLLKDDKETKDIPVIFMTSLSNREHNSEFFQAGAVDYIIKPLQKEELLVRVKMSLKINCYQNGCEKEVEKRTKELEKRVEELVRKKDYYQTVVDYSYDWEYQVDTNGNFVYVSPSCERITGYSVDAFLNSKDFFKSIIHPDDKDIVLSHKNIKLSERDVGVLDFRILTNSGQLRWIGHVCQPVFDSDGSYLGRRSSNRDISKRKLIETEKKQLEQKLYHSQKLETIGTLAGGIAHDFNNLLTPIMGYADMILQELEETSPLYDDLNQILQCSYKGKNLVEQILLFSRQGESTKTLLFLQDLLRDSLKLLNSTTPASIEIVTDIDDSCPEIFADIIQIHQVIAHLFVNARQAMEKKGGTLSIELSRKKIVPLWLKKDSDLNVKEYLCLSITDTGLGVNKKYLDSIFEPFFTTKSVDQGSGLGLSGVHGIVRSHGGEIVVDSESGKGAAFNVFLPVLKFDKKIEKEVFPEVVSGSESIMIVDDEDSITKVIKQMLSKSGYKVEVCNSAKEAFQILKDSPEKFDLLITDFSMPGMNGLDLIEKVHKKYPDFPAVIMTGFGEFLTEAMRKRCDIKNIISKPVTLKELTNIVRKVLGSNN